MNSTARRISEKMAESAFSANQPAPRTEGAWNHRILVVEDESAIADAYRDILGAAASNVVPLRRSSRSAAPNPDVEVAGGLSGASRLGAFELTVVSNAEKAIAEVKHAIKNKRPFTMGFFDVLLGGGMDGIELVKQIHEVDPELYAVFVTAYSDRSVDSIQGFLGEDKAGQWDYLNKPFTKGEILQKARAGVTLWNLRREKEAADARLALVQRQLLEGERLSSAAAVARGIGHEFRNIMTLITGKAELAGDGGETVMKDALAQILKASYRAAEILQRFNYLYGKDEHRLRKQWMHLHQPVDEALALMSHQFKAGGVKVCWIRKKSLPVFASDTGLLQVVVNLLINSLQAMGSGGQIDLSVSEVGGRAELRVRDYGPGIDPSVISQVTEPFFTTKGENGTGLGLAIAKEIIETEHDGRLTLVNHEIKGLEAILSFPLEGGGDGAAG